MSTSDRFSYGPSKIIITVTPSDIFNHPLTVLTHRLSVLRFQRSLCDAYSTSDGILRELNTGTLGSAPMTYGLFFVKDLALSIYKSEGILGFFRCLPEHLAYLLLKDVLRFVVPKFVFPLFSKLNFTIPANFKSYSFLDTKYTSNFRQKWTLARKSEGLMDRMFEFYKKRIESEKDKLLAELAVEIFTYPILTIISRLIIYDGYGPVSFYPLLKHTLAIEGLLSLYNGFIFHLLSNSLKYFLKHFNKFIRTSMESDYFVSPMFEQSVPAILTISRGVLNQFSLIQRCGSNIDGFCIKDTTSNIFRQMPWMSILSQMLITIALLHFKDRLLTKQIHELNSRMYH